LQKKRFREDGMQKVALGYIEKIENINREDDMCLSTVFMDSGTEQVEIMKDVARIEAEGQGFWLTNLFGERRFVVGKLQVVNLTDGHFIMLRKDELDLTLSV
jgi:predicted RNA-binding protein